MNPNNLNIGDRLVWGGVEYEIAHLDRRSIRFMKTRGGDAIIKSLSEFRAWAENKKIKVISAPSDQVTRYANDLNQKQQRTLEKRMAYVKALTDSFSCYSSKSANGPSLLISEIATLRNEAQPGFSTVCTWIKKYISSNYNPHSLLPKAIKQKRRSTFGYLVEQFIAHEVNGYYLEKIRFSDIEIAHELHGKIEEYTIHENMPSTTKVPSIRTLQRRIGELDPYKKYVQIYGKDKTGKSFKAAGKQIELIRAFQEVEADGNYIDVILLNDFGEIIGRAYLTVLIDRFSRCVLSYELSFIPFSSHTLQIALKKAFNEDNGLPGRKIERLIVDNGSDYISSSIQNLCNYTGTSIEYAPPDTPNSKPFVERFFLTLNTQLFHKLPGTTFSNPTERGNYDSNREAKLTISELKSAIDEFIDIYHNSFHQGLIATPAQIMQKELKRHVLYTYSSKDLDVVAKTIINRNINKGRITAFRSKWYSHALRTIEHQFSVRKIPQDDRKVTVYVDVLNLGKLLIKDPFNENNFIEADSVTPEYHNGLSLYEHRLTLAEISNDFKVSKETQSFIIKRRMALIRSLHESSTKADRKKVSRMSDLDPEDFLGSESIPAIDQMTKSRSITTSPIDLRKKLNTKHFELEYEEY